MYQQSANKSDFRQYFQNRDGNNFYESDFFSYELKGNAKIFLDALFSEKPKGFYSDNDQIKELADLLKIEDLNAVAFIERLEDLNAQIRKSPRLSREEKVGCSFMLETNFKFFD